MIYCDYIIFGRIIPFKSPPESENIDEYIKNEKLGQCMTQLPESSWE